MRAASIDFARKMKKLEKTCKKFFTSRQYFVGFVCRRRATLTPTNQDKMNTTTTPIAASFEIIFDNAGGATLQNHEGTFAMHYSDMEQLAHDVKELDNGDDATTWDGIDLCAFISDEEYEKHVSSGGYYALQLDPEYRFNWPDAEEIGWNNVANFLRAFLA